METNLIVIDNFYSNVDEVRKFALTQDFYVVGNYPGARTDCFLNQETRKTIEDVLFPYSGKVIDWFDRPNGYSGSFQITTEKNKSWVHSDYINNWAGILYLTPNAPLSSGTAFFKSKIDESFLGKSNDFQDEVWSDMSKWEKVTDVGNVYNRLILFRSMQWHTALNYFGSDIYNGRLTQVFFMTTER
jgi:hypothetical protein